MKRITIAIPTTMYKRFAYERKGYGRKTVKQVIQDKLRFWCGAQEDKWKR